MTRKKGGKSESTKYIHTHLQEETNESGDRDAQAPSAKH